MNESGGRRECAFDAFCKHTLKNETINAGVERKRRRHWEVSFSELTQTEEQQLRYIDVYSPERRTFPVPGGIVEVTDGALGKALDTLTNQRRDIVRLSYLLGLTDNEISQCLGVGCSTVQYRRTSTLKQLRKLMEEYDHE